MADLVHAHALPELKWKATKNQSPRHGHKIRMVVVHRWASKFTNLHAEALSYDAVVKLFEQDRGSDSVSSHIVYPGSAVPGEATQMVPWHLKAWTEAYYNPDCVEIESADAIWLGHDPAGFHQLAHMVAWMLHHWHLPPTQLSASGVVHGSGFCRHYDLGALGGGHSCPTTDQHLWNAFASLVKSEYHRGGFRETWGKT